MSQCLAAISLAAITCLQTALPPNPPLLFVQDVKETDGSRPDPAFVAKSIVGNAPILETPQGSCLLAAATVAAFASAIALTAMYFSVRSHK